MISKSKYSLQLVVGIGEIALKEDYNKVYNIAIFRFILVNSNTYLIEKQRR